MHFEPEDNPARSAHQPHESDWRPTPDPEPWDDWDLAPPSQLWQPHAWDEDDAEPDPEFGDFWPELDDRDN